MNLVVNGGFQTGNFSGWTVGGTPSVNTNGYPSGPLPYYAANFATAGSIRQNIPVIPGTRYYANFRVRGLASSGAAVLFNVIGNNSSNVYITSQPLAFPDWTQYLYTFVVLPTDTSVLLRAFAVLVALDTFWLSTSPTCYTGDTLIRTLSLKTNQREETRADAITSTSHRVVNTDDQEIEVIKNIVSGPATRLVTFSENKFGPGLPYTDLRMTRGHKLVIDGKEIRAGDLSVEKDGVPPRGEYGRCEPELVYSLVLPTHQHIYANGQPVVAFGLDEWNAVSEKVSHTTTDELEAAKRFV